MVDYKTRGTVHNDEPSLRDLLGREQFVAALARVAATCETPLVIGLYGSWGIGKTSLMRQIESVVAAQYQTKTIWFPSWQHQFDEAPPLALLHAMVDSLKLGGEAKKLVALVATTLGAAFLKLTSSISLEDIDKVVQWYEDERFQIGERQVRLSAYVRALVNKATEEGRRRLVFFVDDLDRCVPETILKMLEALKLYLNLPNCVYFLAVDRTALENSIRQRYKKLEMREADYLDKIVQLPFVIPPIPSESIDEFVASLLPRALLPAKEILTTGLGDNPRQVKRFINMLVLNHHMAAESRIWCDPCVLALVLLLQHRQPGLFKLIASEPALLSKLHDKTKLSKEVFETYLATDERLRRVVEANPVPEYVPVASYIYLTKFARVGEGVFDIVLTSVGPNKINAIKIIRQVTGADLREAKEMVDNTPSTILSGVSQRTAEAIKARFEDTQLVVEIR